MTKRFTILMRATPVLAFALFFSAEAESLDDALNKQKEKAKRRIFSQPANLADQNLAIPKAPTDEEMELDRKIEALERKLDQQAAENPTRLRPPRPATMPVVPKDENSNWLTPALLDEDAALKTPDEDSWMTQELERQKQKRLEQQERELLEQKMSEGIRPLRNKERNEFGFPERNRPEPNIYKRPSYLSERETTTTTAPKKEKKTVLPKSSDMFSPTDYTGSSIVEDPFSAPTQPTLRPEQSRPKRSSTIDWETPSSQPRTPLNRVRESNPIHKRDPFSDDFMPDIKTSIWD
jgi:hypothetical protein